VNILQAIGKLEGLASDQMYTEQKWVTTYLKNIRNEADRQSTSLQVNNIEIKNYWHSSKSPWLQYNASTALTRDKGREELARESFLSLLTWRGLEQQEKIGKLSLIIFAPEGYTVYSCWSQQCRGRFTLITEKVRVCGRGRRKGFPILLSLLWLGFFRLCDV
jgi:hypothetical protein